MAIFLLVLFVVSITATAVTASQADYNNGYDEGCRQGSESGFKDGQAGSTFCTLKSFESKPEVIDFDKGYTQGYGDCYPKGYDAVSEYTR